MSRHAVATSTSFISKKACAILLALAPLLFAVPLRAGILWSVPDSITVHETGPGDDILHGAVKRDETSAGTLYFKFRVDPLSDVSKEEYFAAFELFENDTEHLAVGNSRKAWAYSAFNTSEKGVANQVAGDVDLFSSRPEAYDQEDVQPYELPRRGTPCTIVFKVEYIPGADDLVTVWMNPNLSRGAMEENQLKSLTTKFKANASFNQIRLRHGGLGAGWTFSEMAIATSFNDFIVLHFWQRWWFIASTGLFFMAVVASTVRFVERRKFQSQLNAAERERAVEVERSRIARDLHDDLGSLVTRISLLSDLLLADKDNPADVETHATKISQSANQTVRALEEIVWAVRPGSDSLQSLIEYISHFANELFENDKACCRLDLPQELLPKPLPPDVRHNIFLVIKEALTNALKHACAREVYLQIKVSGDILEIRVQDNGKGFTDTDAPDKRHGQGLGNMRSRAEAISGTLSVKSEPGKGTIIVLRVPLPDTETLINSAACAGQAKPDH